MLQVQANGYYDFGKGFSSIDYFIDVFLARITVSWHLMLFLLLGTVTAPCEFSFSLFVLIFYLNKF